MYSPKPLFKVTIQKKTLRKKNYKMVEQKIVQKDSITAVFHRKNYVKFSFPKMTIINAIKIEKQKQRKLDSHFNMILPNTNYTTIPNYINFSEKKNIIKIKNNIKDPYQICMGKKLNSFMAFRAYYSQFAEGLKQQSLSIILSKEWKKEVLHQQFWVQLTETCKPNIL